MTYEHAENNNHTLVVCLNKSYRTRNGHRVEIDQVDVHSSTKLNSVVGYIYFTDYEGVESKIGELFLWSINGKRSLEEDSDLDLVEI